MGLSERKTLIEEIEDNKRMLKVEYQRGYADGGVNMNAKWLITRDELISEFLEDMNLSRNPEEYLLKKIVALFEDLEEAEHWSIEGLEIIPRTLVMQIIEKYKRFTGLE